jgi:hypothetical protein
MGVYAVRPTPHCRYGYLTPSDDQAVVQWITLNEGVILDYWNSAISTAEMLQRIQPLSPPVPP